MAAARLTDEQWAKMYAYLLECRHVSNYGEANMRRFIEAVHWVARSGAAWRYLPTDYGKWNSVFKRFSRWADAGVWEKLLEYVSSDLVVSLLVDVSTTTGEEVLLFTLAESPHVLESKKK